MSDFVMKTKQKDWVQ